MLSKTEVTPNIIVDGLSVNEVRLHIDQEVKDYIDPLPPSLFLSFNKPGIWYNNMYLYDKDEGLRTFIEYTRCYARFPVKLKDAGWIWRKHFYLVKFIMFSGFFRYHKLSEEDFIILTIKGLI